MIYKITARNCNRCMLGMITIYLAYSTISNYKFLSSNITKPIYKNEEIAKMLLRIVW